MVLLMFHKVEQNNSGSSYHTCDLEELHSIVCIKGNIVAFFLIVNWKKSWYVIESHIYIGAPRDC